MPDSGTVLVGEGLLAEAIAECGEVYRAAAALLGDLQLDCSAMVVASDGWDARAYTAVRAVCRSRSIPWLPVRTELGRAVVGPLELPGLPGCHECAELRRRLARRHREGHDAVRRRHEATLADTPSSWLTGLAADLVAALVTEELSALGSPSGCVRTRQGLMFIDLDDLMVSTHRFLPDPLCRICGRLPDDTAALARIALGPRPKAAPDRYRVRSLAEELDHLVDLYVDAESGLVQALTTGTDGGLMVAGAPLGLRDDTMLESGYGRTRSYRNSQLIALLEALERYGGVEPGGKRTVVSAAFADICDHALDPRALGLHSPEHYQLPGFRFQPFEEDRPCRWVWGYSFARREPILVPEAIAYYRVHRKDAPPPFVYEISNGCALGSCLEEAILYGILEVAERDAFLMTWYARMAAPGIDLRSAGDRALPLLVDSIEAETGYEILAFDITLEQHVPCVWAMAVDASGEATGPRAVCAAGSHLDPERAAENAISELGPILTDLIRRYPQERDHGRRMVLDPSLVRSMHDHSVLYGDHAAFGRFDFLIRGQRVRRFSDLPSPTAFRNADLRDDLLELVGRYLDSGLDIVVVDQTTPEHRVGGFSCVKVVIPGTLPMTFGHTFRRVHGLPRLLHLPQQLGYRDGPLKLDDLNPHPHPFP
jgi:ribosomal protein S12 methylthiotransferase accessory factor